MIAVANMDTQIDSEVGITQRLCDFIARSGAVCSAEITAAFPEVGGNPHAFLKRPLLSGYLVSCIVRAPDRRGALRESAQFRVSESASGRSYKEWKAHFNPQEAGDLKPPKLGPRAAAALAASSTRETLAVPVKKAPVSKATAPQPAVGKNTGSAGLVALTSKPFAEACSVATSPAASDAPTPDQPVGNETVPTAVSVAQWSLHSDGSMRISKGEVHLSLSPGEALQLARVCGLVTPYLAENRSA